MITVRFPSGFSIQYNDARFVYRSNEYSDLYESSKKLKWIAQVPNSCVIEILSPCRLYNPISSASESVQIEVSALAKEVRSLKRLLAKKVSQ